MSASSELEVEVDDAAVMGLGDTQPTPPVHLWQEPEDLVGLVLSKRYKLQRVIGQGGMGAVYLAEHVVIGKTIAVKVLSPEYSQSPGDVQRFLQEARTASLVRHDHIVDISDFGYTPQGQAFLVMEYLEGEDLAYALRREGRMPWFRMTNLMLQISSALAAAHAKGVIHRDMKPENCFLVRRDDGEDFVKVLDFGIAKIVDKRLKQPGASLTIKGGIMGTPEYIAPELVKGQTADARVDIYALGVIMYRLLTGTLPFTTDTANYMAILSAHLLEPPEPPSRRAPEAAIPRPIEAIVLRALAKDPAARYQTVEDLIAALREAQLLLTGASSTAFMPNLPVIVPRTLRAGADRRRRRRWLALGLSAAGLGAAGVWLATRPAAVDDVAVREGPSGHVQEAIQPPEPRVATPAPPDATPAPPPAPPPAAEPAAEVGAERPASRSDAEFRRVIEEVQRAVKSKCAGLPGMQVRAKIYVRADGTVGRVVPEGSLAGSALATCVVKEIRAARFGRSSRASVRTATFKL